MLKYTVRDLQVTLLSGYTGYTYIYILYIYIAMVGCELLN